ncbi:MAG: calcium-binding protein [Aestuariivirga sp.]
MPQPIKTTIGDLFIDSGTNQEVDPILVARADGRFRAGWMDNAGSAEYDVLSNLYTAGAGWMAGDFVKNTTTSIESHIGIGMLSNGTQAFAWSSSTGGNADIFAEIRDINGVVLAPAFQINTGGSFATGNQDRPEAVGLDTGNFAFVWIDRNAGNITFAIHNTSGGQVTAPTVLSQTAAVQNFGSPPTTVRFDTALLQNGNFVVAYTNNDLDTVFRVVSPTGSFITNEIGVDSNATTDNVGASVATLADGRFVAVTFDVNNPMVQGQIFNADGTTSVALFNIGTSPNIGRPQVAALHDGRFMAVWNDNGDISARMMFANGTPDGDEFIVNSVTTNTQERPTITVLADGRVVVGWHSDEITSGLRDVKMTIFDPRESALIKTATALAEDWYGTSFDDNVSMGEGLDLFHGGAGNDTAFGENGNDELIGEDGNDTLTGNAGDDFLDGNAGDDILNGGAGSDTLRADAGNDTASYAGSAGAVTVNLANQTASGGNAQGDTISGIENATGGLGADTLTGDGNANTLDGGAGIDGMTGGGGDDIYVLDNAGDGTVEAANGGTDTVQASITHALRSNIENLVLTGSANINGTGNSLDNGITGNAGSNVLNGLTGADDMTGGNGNDTFWIDNAGDTAAEALNEGIDIVQSYIDFVLGDNIEKLYLRPGALNATGNALTNYIYGNNGVNTINGGMGADRMYGYNGHDKYIVDSSGDLVYETSAAGGTDLVEASVNHTLAVNVENLTLTGAGNINGTGNTLANAIVGSSGNNFIDGKLGNDTLTGGLGNDQFLFSTTLGASNIDTITDFSVPNDTIRLDDAIFTGLAPLAYLLASQFVIGAAATDANHRIVYDGATGALLFDADGNGAGAAKQFATIGAGLALTTLDFYIF